ncbi:hypothetical protein D3C87_587980 [compost metagenome]
MTYKLEIKPKNKHGHHPVWFLPDREQGEVPFRVYKSAAKKFQKWMATLPLLSGYETYEWDRTTTNIVYVGDTRDVAIIKLSFDSKLFE